MDRALTRLIPAKIKFWGLSLCTKIKNVQRAEAEEAICLLCLVPYIHVGE